MCFACGNQTPAVFCVARRKKSLLFSVAANFFGEGSCSDMYFSVSLRCLHYLDRTFAKQIAFYSGRKENKAIAEGRLLTSSTYTTLVHVLAFDCSICSS